MVERGGGQEVSCKAPCECVTMPRNNGQHARTTDNQRARPVGKLRWLYVARMLHVAARSTPNEETVPLQNKRRCQKAPLYMGERAAENVDLNAALVNKIKTDK